MKGWLKKQTLILTFFKQFVWFSYPGHQQWESRLSPLACSFHIFFSSSSSGIRTLDPSSESRLSPLGYPDGRFDILEAKLDLLTKSLKIINLDYEEYESAFLQSNPSQDDIQNILVTFSDQQEKWADLD